MMNGKQARIYFQVYRALVGAAFVQSTGRERSYALLRAWAYYATPLTSLLWEEDADPLAVEVAHQLVGWLLWFRDLKDPEVYFRSMMPKEFTRQGVKQTQA